MSYSKESLDAVFHPQSIAVVGAAREPYKWGHLILNGILSGGYTGKVYAINPHADEVLGLSTLPNLRAIGRAVDLAVVVVPAPLVPAVIAEGARWASSRPSSYLLDLARGAAMKRHHALLPETAGVMALQRGAPWRRRCWPSPGRVTCAWWGPTAWASTALPPGSAP